MLKYIIPTIILIPLTWLSKNNNEMAGWHHQLDGHEFGWTPGDGDGQGGLACWDSWDCRVGHNWATELNWTEWSCVNRILRWWLFGEDSWESFGLKGDPTSPFWSRSTLGFLWKEWCWSWNSNTLATSCKELTHWKRLWCWDGLGAGGEGDDRGWEGWMASPTWRTWVWVNSGRWWWTGRPGVLWFMGSRRVRHD